jgi:hypothetical protein
MMTQQAADHGERNLTWLRNTPNLRRNDKDSGVTIMGGPRVKYCFIAIMTYKWRSSLQLLNQMKLTVKKKLRACQTAYLGKAKRAILSH